MLPQRSSPPGLGLLGICWLVRGLSCGVRLDACPHGSWGSPGLVSRAPWARRAARRRGPSCERERAHGPGGGGGGGGGAGAGGGGGGGGGGAPPSLLAQHVEYLQGTDSPTPFCGS